MAKRRMHLLIVDPQNDFCDLPPSHRPEDPLADRGGCLQSALPVPGGHQDLLRIAALIRQGGPAWTELTVTLDTHQRLDIAHPGFWIRDDGAPVPAFTPITAAEVRQGRYKPRHADALERVLGYLDALEASGRHGHMVWPVHCELGTWGHTVHADLLAACQAWQEQGGRNVRWVIKGMNPWTEHFSAVRAEVPDPEDPGTQVNRALLAALAQADRLFIAGEAGSHCVKCTTEDLVEHLDAEQRSRLVLITDGMSPVPGFDASQADFLCRMAAAGLGLARCEEVLQELQGTDGQ